MYDTILIPYDGSDEARRGAEHGIELAAALGASVHALYVVDLPGAPRTVYIRDDEEQIREEHRDYGERVTEELCEMAGEQGVECTTAIRSGSPAEEIVDYAEEHGMDAIVLGSAYQGKFRAILGGTSDKVVRTSSVPVITDRMSVED
ncbi:universal stress protein [Halopenitus persicus]|uniref:Nucleotide-binding universal stress protein, UspA family n=1 Tax=Halopenitus persicus TaxID=1048396 RepID=A0A1H3ERA2_9EURY|nr:universal stress protein [Halopenitus persicus]QHS17661.1 universal stress protein [haloarchaeon 3A1-DGR]SDX81087.1 Nucleotide-binding universal stress protein, UspA family [Halopenitus persicus]